MSEAPLFYTAQTIHPEDRSKIISIRTGIRDIDRKIIGLNKQEISVFSGLRSSAKSSILSQVSLNIADQGKKVALFSGELKATKVLNWMQLQAAGRSNTVATTYENFFTVEPQTLEEINQWIDQKIFIYNNDYGKKTENILTAVEYCIKVKKIDVVILDNLMAIDLGATNFTKNEKQSEFIWKIKETAEKNNVHIILVAHPRKSLGFLRVDDIAGTADLTNAADNVFIIHRVNRDFRRLTADMFGKDHEIYNYDNIIEICKNRDLGYQDEFIGLYFDVTCKQFSCDHSENIYGWRKKEEDNGDIRQQTYWN